MVPSGIIKPAFLLASAGIEIARFDIASTSVLFIGQSEKKVTAGRESFVIVNDLLSWTLDRVGGHLSFRTYYSKCSLNAVL